MTHDSDPVNPNEAINAPPLPSVFAKKILIYTYILNNWEPREQV
jgi:hypothetical protein